VGAARAQSTQPTEEAVRRDHDLVEGELPPVDPPGHELLEHAERRLRRPSDVRVPAEQRGDVREVLPAEELQHLQLGIDPRFETAVDLEDQLVVEDDRAVRLFSLDQA
jgi:hypothetical protein